MSSLKQVFDTTHLFSRHRIQKFSYLLKEGLIVFIGFFRSSRSEKPKPNVDPNAKIWDFHHTSPIDTDYYMRSTVPVVEDFVHDDGLVHAKYKYIIQLLYDASAYTNETTHRSIFTQMDDRVDVFSDTKSILGPKTYSPNRRRLPVTRYVRGVTANLYGTIAVSEGNYFHWFIDSLARLFLIRHFHPDTKINYVLVPVLKYDFQWDSLAYFGFGRDQIVQHGSLESVRFESLLATSAPRGKGTRLCPGWIVDKYRKTLLKESQKTATFTGKRIYISRRDAPSRMFLNEEEVCSYFQDRGYQIVELAALNLWQKIAVFRDADIIVGQTGAGLTNVMYCHSEVRVLELVDERFVYPLYASIVVHGGGIHRAHYFSSSKEVSGRNAIVVKTTLNISDLDNSVTQIESNAITVD